MADRDNQGADSWAAGENSNQGSSKSLSEFVDSEDGSDERSESGRIDHIPEDETDLIPRSSISQGWADLFPFGKVRRDQFKGINSFVDGLQENKFTVLEGACGTGKTLIGLVGGLYVVENSAGRETEEKFDWEGKSDGFPAYERVFIVTSVKNQIEVFKDEMSKINEGQGISGKFDTLVLRGRGDMIPYQQYDDEDDEVDNLDFDVDECRENSRMLVHENTNIPIKHPVENNETANDGDSDESPYDPARIRAVLAAVEDMVSYGTCEELSVDGVSAPYPSRVPRVADVVSEDAIPQGYERPDSLNSAEVNDECESSDDEDSDDEQHDSDTESGLGDEEKVESHSDDWDVELLRKSELNKRIDPFYLKYLLCVHPDTIDPVPIDFPKTTGDLGVLDREHLFTESVREGICPHRLMTGYFLEKADVLVGSYNYLFDENSMVGFKDEVLNPGTIAVVDEAHNLEDRVRGMYEQKRSDQGITQSLNDIKVVSGILNTDSSEFRGIDSLSITDEALEMMKNEVEREDSELGVDVDSLTQTGENSELTELRVVRNFFQSLQHTFHNLESDCIDEALSDSHEFGQEFEKLVENDPDSLIEFDGSLAYSLEPPKNVSKDELSEKLLEDYVENDSFTFESEEKLFEETVEICYKVDEVLSFLSSIDRTSVEDVNKLLEAYESDEERNAQREVWDFSRDATCRSTIGGFLRKWCLGSRKRYFREIVFEPVADPPTIDEMDENQNIDHFQWDDFFTAKLNLFNCLPKEHIQRQLSQVGGGMLMSATLTPMQQYIKSTGLNDLVAPSDEVSEQQLRAYYSPTDDSQPEDEVPPKRGAVVPEDFKMRYPVENRESVVIPLTEYTQGERGSQDDMNEVRQQYAREILRVGSLDGNVLICMPSYHEADWAASILKEHLSKKVLTDESSEAIETQEMIDDFKDTDENAVLVSSLGGTVNEGIDYEGEELTAVAVVGLGMSYLNDRERAKQFAYDECIEGKVSGFHLSGVVPAVRLSRQTIGRVIRGEDERGIRILVDERYSTNSSRSYARRWLSGQEKDEFSTIDPSDLNHIYKDVMN